MPEDLIHHHLGWLLRTQRTFAVRRSNIRKTSFVSASRRSCRALRGSCCSHASRSSIALCRSKSHSLAALAISLRSLLLVRSSLLRVVIRHSDLPTAISTRGLRHRSASNEVVRRRQKHRFLHRVAPTVDPPLLKWSNPSRFSKMFDTLRVYYSSKALGESWIFRGFGRL